MTRKHLPRAVICCLCVLLLVLNSRAIAPVGADGLEPFARPAADALAEQADAAARSAAYRRLAAQRPAVELSDALLTLRPGTLEEPQTVRIEGVSVSARIAEPLQALLAAARESGQRVYVTSGYLSERAQQYVYDRALEHYDWPKVESVVGPLGENEHGSGLAVDLSECYTAVKDESFASTQLYAWLQTHAADYGFVIRYGEGKKPLTGRIFEPWHLRYVGEEAARFMAEHELCLEEFLDLYP